MWFGSKGFASVVYGLIILKSGIALADQIYHLVALVIVLIDPVPTPPPTSSSPADSVATTD